MCYYTLNTVTSSKLLIQWQPFGSYIVLILITQIIAVASIYVWYCISNWNVRITWYNTTEYISMTWYQHDGIWCQDGVDSIIVMRVYDIKTRYISIMWCISAIWSVWHDTTAVWYNILSQPWVTGIMTFQCFDPSVFRCSVFRRLGFSPDNAVILKIL